MQTYSIHLQHIKNTHGHSHNTGIHAGKTASVYIKMANACLYNVFLSTTCNKVSALYFLLSTCRLSHTTSLLPLSFYNEILKISFYLRGLFELFPPIYLPYSITLNGLSSPKIRSRSQPSNIKGLSIYILCA